MKRRNFIKATVLAVSLAAIGTGHAQDKGPIKVGVLHSLSDRKSVV